MRIWLDDERQPWVAGRAYNPYYRWVIVRGAEMAMALIKTGAVKFISFDHDLGSKLTGYDVANCIEALAAAGKIPSIDYGVHSANPVGAKNIHAAMKSAWRFWNVRSKKRGGKRCGR